ncbi:uncharacterized protein LOC116138926 isoform X2 [Pistacia vera]|uniref:uncharacterized protein LOC116138926 isoform X2 n=1 Tax=Pistacia vera TaxID=55513 RepID=UPI0012639323|nr:uncharacterized protein LOC116138926 isoform X2 [Pistacia vera]
MCPLRLIIVFLSATLAGFFLLRNLKSQPHNVLDSDNDCNNTTNSSTQQPPTTPFSKVRLTMESGFWSFVDMASGKYLWRHLVSSSPKRHEDDCLY